MKLVSTASAAALAILVTLCAGIPTHPKNQQTHKIRRTNTSLCNSDLRPSNLPLLQRPPKKQRILQQAPRQETQPRHGLGQKFIQ